MAANRVQGKKGILRKTACGEGRRFYRGLGERWRHPRKQTRGALADDAGMTLADDASRRHQRHREPEESLAREPKKPPEGNNIGVGRQKNRFACKLAKAAISWKGAAPNASMRPKSRSDANLRPFFDRPELFLCFRVAEEEAPRKCARSEKPVSSISRFYPLCQRRPKEQRLREPSSKNQKPEDGRFHSERCHLQR